MELSNKQFPNIFRKGESQSGLRARALESLKKPYKESDTGPGTGAAEGNLSGWNEGYPMLTRAAKNRHRDGIDTPISGDAMASAVRVRKLLYGK